MAVPRLARPLLPEVGTGATRWLEHYAGRFATVEVNNTFYRLPAPATFEQWKARVPADFVIAVKASRYLTHYKRLREPEEPVDRLHRPSTRNAGRAPRTGAAAAPARSPDRAASVSIERCARSARRVRVAVEPRHRSWFVAELRDVLTAHGAALCLADRGSRPITPLWRTADWCYVRLHAGRRRRHRATAPARLASWVTRLTDLWSRTVDGYVVLQQRHGRLCRSRRRRDGASAEPPDRA